MKYRGRRDFMSEPAWSGEPMRAALGIVGGFFISVRSL